MRETVFGIRCCISRCCNFATKRHRLSFPMPNSSSMQASRSRGAHGGVSALQAVSFSCCSSQRRHAPSSSRSSTGRDVDRSSRVRPLPVLDRVVVHQQDAHNSCTADAIVQKNQCGHAPPQTLCGGLVRSQLSQFFVQRGSPNVARDGANRRILVGSRDKRTFSARAASGIQTACRSLPSQLHRKPPSGRHEDG